MEEKIIFNESLFTPPCELWGGRATYKGTEWIQYLGKLVACSKQGNDFRVGQSPQHSNA